MNNQRKNQCLSFFLVLLGFYASNVLAKVSPEQFGVIVNTKNPDSVLIAKYYREKRKIPEENIIEIELPFDEKSIGKKMFNSLYRQVKKRTPSKVQYYVIAWTKPYRVACMSITSAFAFGFDESFCATGCRATKSSAYYNSNSESPGDDLGVLPSMMLAGSSLQQVYDMIDRGVQSDSTKPHATAYLMSTADKDRNVRARRYKAILEKLADEINIEKKDSNVLINKNDVMFYFTGLKHVNGIKTNQYLPGAIADHLTSTGGDLVGGKQMSVLRWLDVGVTGSYGTVVEPCAFSQKFPNPAIVIDRYTNGESLIEAYWKSVAWPGQGVFVGEPMASPYASRK